MGKIEMAMEAMNRIGKMGESLPKEDMLKGMGTIVIAAIWAGCGVCLYKSGDRAMGYVRDIVCHATK